MHEAAHTYVHEQVLVHGPFSSVLEIGSLDINGSVRDIFPGAFFWGVDVQAGRGVDEQRDFATRVKPSTEQWDCVVCCEVLEHADDEHALAILTRAHEHLEDKGVLILTAAGPGRAPHSARRESAPDPDEHYRNVDFATLAEWLRAAGFKLFEIDTHGLDIRATAWKGMERQPIELVETMSDR